MTSFESIDRKRLFVFCLQSVPRMMCPAVALDKVIHVQPETFELPMKDGENYIKITPPCAHSGPAPIHVRLMSARLREGQVT